MAYFHYLIRYFYMSLIPNNKKKKDGKAAGNQKGNNPSFPAPKGKANSKGKYCPRIRASLADQAEGVKE